MIAQTAALGLLTVCVNAALMVVKILTGIAGNSSALIADGIESAADIFTSLVTWMGFHLSLRPPDENHPYGHGRIETLAGLFAAASLLSAAAFIAWHSIQQIQTPAAGPEWFTLPVLLLVVGAKWMLARKVQAFGREAGSRALEGDAWHHFSDSLTSAAAAIGISVALLGGPGWESADDFAALFACAIIVLNGVLLARGALHDMLDGSVPARLAGEIRDLASRVPGVVEIEKCRVRKSGTGLFVELHVCVRGDTTVRQGHQIGHAVKDHLLRSNPSILDAVIHLEPADPENPAGPPAGKS